MRHVVMKHDDLTCLDLDRDRLLLGRPRSLINDAELSLTALPIDLIALAER